MGRRSKGHPGGCEKGLLRPGSFEQSSGQVTLPAHRPAQHEVVPGFTSNQFGFGLTGLAASSFVVEASTNLQTWRPLSTNTFGAGLFQFVDPGSITNPIRFYRTRY